MSANTMPSQEAKILARLKQSEGEWVPMPELMAVSGSSNVHSRKAILVKRGYRVENKVVLDHDGRSKHSFYRLVPGGVA